MQNVIHFYWTFFVHLCFEARPAAETDADFLESRLMSIASHTGLYNYVKGMQQTSSTALCD